MRRTSVLVGLMGLTLVLTSAAIRDLSAQSYPQTQCSPENYCPGCQDPSDLTQNYCSNEGEGEVCQGSSPTFCNVGFLGDCGYLKQCGTGLMVSPVILCDKYPTCFQTSTQP
jgi:hypothetical protein